MGETVERTGHRSPVAKVQEVRCPYRGGSRLRFGETDDPLRQSLDGSISVRQNPVNKRNSPLL